MIIIEPLTCTLIHLPFHHSIIEIVFYFLQSLIGHFFVDYSQKSGKNNHRKWVPIRSQFRFFLIEDLVTVKIIAQ